MFKYNIYFTWKLNAMIMEHVCLKLVLKHWFLWAGKRGAITGPVYSVSGGTGTDVCSCKRIPNSIKDIRMS